MDNSEKTYWPKEVADLLGIVPSTLRKWCLQLERDGYVFLRDEHERRAFTEHDIIALRKFKSFLANNMSMDNASNAVVTRYKEDRGTLRAIHPEMRSPMRDEQIFDFIQRQEAFNKALLERLEKQEKYIKDVLDKRDEKLVQVMREMLETRQMISAGEEKKPWWKRIFKGE